MRARKASVLTLATALIAWAIQQLAAGDTYTGAGGIVLGALLLAAYEHLQLRQLPTTLDDLQDASRRVGDHLEETIDDHRDGT